jgi:hypothetical protein
MSEDATSPAKVAASVAGEAAAAVARTKLVQKVVGQVGKALGAVIAIDRLPERLAMASAPRG